MPEYIFWILICLQIDVLKTKTVKPSQVLNELHSNIVSPIKSLENNQVSSTYIVFIDFKFFFTFNTFLYF